MSIVKVLIEVQLARVQEQINSLNILINRLEFDGISITILQDIDWYPTMEYYSNDESTKKIKEGTEVVVLDVVVLDFSDVYIYKVSTNGNIGYMPSNEFPVDNRLKKLGWQDQLEREQEERQRAKKAEEESEVRRQRLIKKYGIKVASRLMEEKIWIGMADTLMRESFGEPDSVNRTVTSTTISEQWIYRSESNTYYVYFENGILTSWQE